MSPRLAGVRFRKADTLTYSVTSPENMNATMNDVFSSNGFEVYDYRDVKEKCGGVDPNAIYKMFANADELPYKLVRQCSMLRENAE